MPYGHGWGWSWGMGVGMLLFWAAVFAGIVLLARALATRGRVGAGGPDGGHDETPLDILEKRYARGEIDRAEFEERKHDLQR